MYLLEKELCYRHDEIVMLIISETSFGNHLS